MKTFLIAVTVVLLNVALIAAPTNAADPDKVELSDLHLCCGGCEDALVEALESVKGVSDIKVDRKAATAQFQVKDRNVLEAALEAVAKAGMYGTIVHNGEKLPMKVADLPDTKVDRAVFSDVHLCCRSCARSVAKALEDLEDVVAVDCDVKARTVTLTGKSIDLDAVYEALHKAGFHGTLAD